MRIGRSALRANGERGDENKSLQVAAEHHRAGQLGPARQLCEAVLERHPDSPEALHLLGLIAYDDRDRGAAAALIRQAIRRAPDTAHYYCNLGAVLHGSRQLDAALAAYNRAVCINADFVSAHRNRGHALRGLGRLADAAEAYRRVLRLRPQDADTYNDLGVVLQQMGRLAEALAAFDDVLELAPHHAGAHFNRGNILFALGRLNEAVAEYDTVIALEASCLPAHLNRVEALTRLGRTSEALTACDAVLRLNQHSWEAHFARGVVLEQEGRFEAALSAYDMAISSRPDHAPSHSNRGNVLKALRRPSEALAAYDRAIELGPGFAETHNNRAYLLLSMGRHQDAFAACRDALRLDPTLAAALVIRGGALLGLKRPVEALAAFDNALRLNPALAEAHFYRGNLLREQLRLDDAVRAYGQAITYRPRFGHAHNNMGTVLQALGRSREALAAFDAALAIDPHHASAHANRANVLMDRGKFQQATLAFGRALELDPALLTNHSNYLNCLNYDPGRNDAELLAAHKAWGERHGEPQHLTRRHANGRDAGRPLRVGLVSADLGRHPVGYLVQPLMEAADPTVIGFYCYSGRGIEDDLSHRLRSLAKAWRRTDRLSDEDLASAIEADGIDILIDLAGHTAGNRLGCFARKPAPVQVHWAGYAYTTGLPAIDYALWDAVHVPEGEERWYTETVVRLPIRWCYAPPEYAPDVAPPPALTSGHVTFGSFNNLSKISPQVVETWSGILGSVAGSRLLLSWKTLADPEECERTRRLFAASGVAPERIELIGGAPTHAGVLAQYDRVDIGLDPFPYSGGLTTLEALWMGVPVITLPASRPVSRQSASLLMALGRGDWVATDEEHYLRLARDLARQPDRLAVTRQGQRPLMARSPLCDGTAFTRAFEAALRRMWRTWCSATAPARPSVPPRCGWLP